MKYFIYLMLTTSLANAITLEKDGKEYSCSPKKTCEEKLKELKAENKKLKSTPIIVEKVIEKHVAESKKENKNILMLELRKDVKDVSTSTSGNSATTKLNKDIIAGVNYYRRQVIENVGFGVGIDSNSTVKGMLGYEW